MGTMNGSLGVTNSPSMSHAPDPFEISYAIKNITAKERYNEIVEKKSSAAMLSTSNVVPNVPSPGFRIPHQSSSTPHLGCAILQPIPAPSSARTTAAPQSGPYALPGINMAAMIQQQKKLQSKNQQNKQQLLDQHIEQQKPIQHQQKEFQQVQRSTQAPPIVGYGAPYDLQRLSKTTTTESTHELCAFSPSRASFEPSSTTISKNTSNVDPANSRSNSHSRNASNMVHSVPRTAAAQTTFNVVASASDVLYAAESVSSTAQSTVASSQNSKFKVNEVDITSLLPPPSELFLSGANTSSASTTNSPKTITTCIIPSLSFPSTSVIEHMTTTEKLTPAAVSLSSKPISSPVQLPKEPLIPTPLYPTLESVATPVQPPAPVPTPVASPLPIFNAQRSVGVYPSMIHNECNHMLTYQQYNSPLFLTNGTGFMPAYSSSILQQLPANSSTPLISQQPRPTSTTNIVHTDDVLTYFDPLNTLEPSTSRGPQEAAASELSQSVSSSSLSKRSENVTRAEEMEVLYDEASFVDRSVCDWMVGQCNGDIAESLKRLKVTFLVEQKLAKDTASAIDALESKKWDLNAAAEFLLSSP